MDLYCNAFYNPDEEGKKRLYMVFYETTFPTWLDIIQKRLTSNISQKYIVGNKLSIADIALADFFYSKFLNEKNSNKDIHLSTIEHYPTLLAYIQVRGEEFKEYFATRRQSEC